jgi:hypothetical protein
MRHEPSIPIRTPSDPNLRGIYTDRAGQSILNPLYVANNHWIIESAVFSLQILSETLAEHKLFSNLSRLLQPGNLTPRRGSKNCEEGQAGNE